MPGMKRFGSALPTAIMPTLPAAAATRTSALRRAARRTTRRACPDADARRAVRRSRELRERAARVAPALHLQPVGRRQVGIGANSTSRTRSPWKSSRSARPRAHGVRRVVRASARASAGACAARGARFPARWRRAPAGAARARGSCRAALRAGSSPATSRALLARHASVSARSGYSLQELRMAAQEARDFGGAGFLDALLSAHRNTLLRKRMRPARSCSARALAVPSDAQGAARQRRPRLAIDRAVPPEPRPPRRRRCRRPASRRRRVRTRAGGCGRVDTCAKPTLQPSGNADRAISGGPSVATGARATSSTSITACGLPIDTAPKSTRRASISTVYVRLRQAERNVARVEPRPAHVDAKRPSSRRPTATGPDGLSSRVVAGALRAARPATRRRNARRCRTAGWAAVGIPDAVVTRRRSRAGSIVSNWSKPTPVWRSAMRAICAGAARRRARIDDDEIVAEPVHLAEMQTIVRAGSVRSVLVRGVAVRRGSRRGERSRAWSLAFCLCPSARPDRAVRADPCCRTRSATRRSAETTGACATWRLPGGRFQAGRFIPTG